MLGFLKVSHLVHFRKANPPLPAEVLTLHVLNIVRHGVVLPPCSKTTHIQYQAWMLIIPNEQCYNMALMRRLEPIPPYYYSFVQKRCHSK